MIWSKAILLIKRYIPLLLVIVVIAQLYFFRKERSRVQDFKQLISLKNKELETWRDTAGKNRARAAIAEIDAANAKTVLNNELKALIKKEVGNIKRNLISYSKVNANTTGEIKSKAVDTMYVIDSTTTPKPAKRFSIDNPDLKFDGYYIPSLDSLLADYKVKHNFEIFYYYKKPGKTPWNLFRKKKAVAELRFENHGSQADSLFTVVLKRKKGFWKRILGK